MDFGSLSFLFCFFYHHFSLRGWCFFVFNKMWAGIDWLSGYYYHPGRQQDLDLDTQTTVKKRCRKSREMGNNLCWVCSRNCRFCGLNAWSTREGGVHHGPVPTKTQSLFSSQNTSRQAGFAASDKNLWAEKKEGRKEGRKWVMFTAHVCVCVWLLSSSSCLSTR